MDTQLDTSNKLGFMIQHVAFSLMRLNDQVLQERLGVGFSQFKLMMVLQKKPHIQQKEIAKSLNQTEASISRQISLLQDKGLLQTTVNPKNRRQHITTLTPKGVRFTEEAMRILGEYYKPIFEHSSDKQQAQMLEGLQAVHQETCHGAGAMCQQFMNNTKG